jgi:ribosomal protein S28E/S33
MRVRSSQREAVQHLVAAATAAYGHIHGVHIRVLTHPDWRRVLRRRVAALCETDSLVDDVGG